MNKQYRLTWRREQAAKSRQERFVTAYVKAKQPKLYDEAIEFHNTLRKKYPNKMDLRKVPEVQQLVFTPATLQTYERMDHSGIHTSGRPLIEDNLELRIPLLQLATPDQDQDTPSTASTVPNTSVPEPATPDQDQATPSTASTVPNTSVPEPATPYQDQATPSTASTVPNTSEPGLFGEVAPLDISDGTIKAIIEELQKDSQLGTFFDDIDIDIPDMSPLEQELFW